MGLCRALAGLLLASLLSQACSKTIVQHAEDKVLLSCSKGVTWIKGTKGEMLDNETMDLGKSILDPRGLYQCEEEKGEKKSTVTYIVQVYYRMCQSCVELELNTMIGILVANVIATLLLALGVYCFAGHELGRVSRAQ